MSISKRGSRHLRTLLEYMAHEYLVCTAVTRQTRKACGSKSFASDAVRTRDSRGRQQKHTGKLKVLREQPFRASNLAGSHSVAANNVAALISFGNPRFFR
jgi:hypothetical protein